MKKADLIAINVAYDKAIKFDPFYEIEQAADIAKNLLTFDDAMQEMFGVTFDENKRPVFGESQIEALEKMIIKVRRAP